MKEFDEVMMQIPSENYSKEAEEMAAALFSKLIPILAEKDQGAANLIMQHPGVFVRPLARRFETKNHCDANIKELRRVDLANKISDAEESGDEELTHDVLEEISDLLRG